MMLVHWKFTFNSGFHLKYYSLCIDVISASSPNILDILNTLKG